MPSDTYTLIISDTGVSVPTNHASSHITGGSDVISTATSSASGLMSSAIFNQHIANTAKVSNVTHTGDVTDTSGVIKVTKINNVQMSSLATGIVKNTTGTGAPSIAIATDFPTLNQNTTGNALTATTAAKATNIAGGNTGSVPYQTANDSTALLASGASGTVLKSNGAAAPSWSAVEKSMLSSALSTEITTNTAKVSNVTHTGDVTDTSGVIKVTKINNVQMSSLATGIVKNTTGTGAPSIAIATDFPVLNQSTTGNAATATNLASGSAGSIPYQSAPNTTVMLVGSSGTFLKSNGAADPAWVSIAKTDLSPALQTEITNAATTAINSTNATNATNLTGGNSNSLPYQSATGVTAMLPSASSGFLKANGSSAPSWSAVTLGDITGTVSATSGGTGQSSYSTGDILYANSTTSLAKLPSGVTGNVLISGGTGVAPSYSKVGLTTHVSGILPIANGGTGTSSGVSLADVSGTLSVTNGGTGVTTSTGSGANALATSPTLITPILGTPTSGTLTSCTGLPLTTGVTGTLPVANGGTGAVTLTGYVKGTGTTPMTANATVPAGDISGTLPVTNGGTGVTTSTGSGANALATSPTLITPILGTPTSGTLTSCTGLPLTTGVTGTLPVANGGTGNTQSAYGEYYISSIAATTIVTPGQYVKVAGTTTAGTLSNFTHTSGNRLTYTGTATRKFFVSASVSFHGYNGTDFAFAIGIDNNIITASIVEQTGESAADLSNISVQCIVELANNQFIEVFTTSMIGLTNPTVDHMNVVVIGLI